MKPKGLDFTTPSFQRKTRSSKQQEDELNIGDILRMPQTPQTPQSVLSIQTSENISDVESLGSSDTKSTTTVTPDMGKLNIGRGRG